MQTVKLDFWTVYDQNVGACHQEGCYFYNIEGEEKTEGTEVNLFADFNVPEAITIHNCTAGNEGKVPCLRRTEMCRGTCDVFRRR